MVERHTVESPRRDPANIPEENVERQGDQQLSVFEWYCPACAEWLGWPQVHSHAARRCEEATACAHTEDGACGHVVCPACGTLADSHEWVLEGDQAGRVARQIFDDSVETELRQALLEDLQRVTQGESVDDILDERKDLFEEYTERVDETEKDA